MTKKVILGSIFLSLIFTAISCLVNNRGQCCDLIFQAGWPWPFWGGSGGFAGYQQSRLILKGLLLDLIFWFLICFVFLTALFRCVPFLKRSLKTSK